MLSTEQHQSRTLMKKTLLHISILGAALALSANAAEETNLPAGQFDFGSFSPPDKGQFVEVRVNSNLINMAARLVEREEPEAAKVLAGLKSIRINVIGLDKDNSAELKERMQSIRERLSEQGWERLVTVKEKGQDVGIFAKLRGEDAVEGIAITVIDQKKEAVFINVVGDIRPEQLADVADHLNLQPLHQISMAMGHNHESSKHDPDNADQ